MNRKRGFYGVLVLLAAVAITGPLVAQDGDAATGIIAQVNQWRIEAGVWPLAVNDTLTLAARGQPYVWPAYDGEVVVLDEIRDKGSVAGVLALWGDSSADRDILLSDRYREIGAAVVADGAETAVAVVLGSRPGVLPVLVAPSGDFLYLSAEKMRTAVSVELLDADGHSLSGAAVPWQLTLAVPALAGDTLAVRYSGGDETITTEVDLSRDVALLSGAAITEHAPVIVFATVTPRPVLVPQALSSPTPTRVLNPTLTPTSDTPELLLVYDARSLSVINRSGSPVDLSQVELVGSAGRLPLTEWTTMTQNLALDRFPAGTCVQVWPRTAASPPSAPDGCRIRWSVLTITPERVFWTEDSFDVQWRGQVLARCAADAGQCQVDLP